MSTFKFRPVDITIEHLTQENAKDTSAEPTIRALHSPEARACRLALEELVGSRFCEDPRDNNIAVSTVVDNILTEVHDHLVRRNIVFRMTEKGSADIPAEVKLGLIASYYLHDTKQRAELNRLLLKQALADMLQTGTLS